MLIGAKTHGLSLRVSCFAGNEAIHNERMDILWQGLLRRSAPRNDS